MALGRGFLWGIQYNPRVRVSARVFWPRSSANKVQPNLKALFFVLYHSNAFWKLLRLGNSAWDFWGINLCSGNFFGFC